ncbi:MAG TPA: HAMP domain-containing sensor histidine kinase [Sediminibacterium sp.]|nr:HAMP domain-containing sensor histidine kinase [Sediminibacterium sp.]
MMDYHKIPYVNIDRQKLSSELNKRGAYFSNVAVWTILFSLPLFWLLDLLFMKDDWVLLLLLRLSSFVVSYSLYTYGIRSKWNYELVLNLVVGTNVVLTSFICGIIPLANALPYFLLASIMMLLLNTTVFWRPLFAQLHCAISYTIIVLLYTLNNRLESYGSLIASGGGVYFLVSAFSCLIAYNRYQIIKRETEKNLIIEESNRRMLEQNEKINDQHHLIEEANRRLKELSDYRQNTLNIMIHDLKNFIGSNQISIDLINRKSSNLTSDQKEILSYITMGNEKLHYLSQKLAESAEADTGKIEYRFEEFDIVPEVEKAAIALVDAASIKQVSLQVHLSPSEIIVNLDKIFLRHILFKLLSNVIRFIQKGSALSIHAADSDGWCIIEIINKATPIGTEKLDEYFNRLHAPNQSEYAVTQSGMGFSVAKQLTTDMGGTLSYESNPTVGNYFKLKFKLA